MEYVPNRRIDMRRDPLVSEKWVQALLEDDPSLLGLGDVNLKDSERRQGSGGRLDLLLTDPETQTRYEVELMLGPTDETHIIRTIEYWDLERRRYPQYEHVAVIVAEDITARFFNVISLLNGAIPIIAIQMSLLEVEGLRTLVFTRVLDHVTLATDEEDEVVPAVDRAYWLSKASEDGVRIAEELIGIARAQDPTLQPSYNRHYISVQRDGSGRLAVLARPRQKSYAIGEFKLPDDADLQQQLVDEGFDLMPYDAHFRFLRIRLTDADLRERRPALERLVAASAAHYDGGDFSQAMKESSVEAP